MKNFVGIVAVVALMAAPAFADPSIGGTFKFGTETFTNLGTVTLSQHTGWSSGGAFWVNLKTGSLAGSVYENTTAPTPTVYTTFCIENGVYFNWDTPYVFSIDQMAYTGNTTGGDQISDITEWIYDKWTAGELGSYTQGQISQAIWAAEGEGGSMNAVYQAAAADLGYGTGYTGVPNGNAEHTYALNLWYNFQEVGGVWVAQDRQTQLITMAPGEPPVVPAPGAALLAGLGLALVGWVKRRIA